MNMSPWLWFQNVWTFLLAVRVFLAPVLLLASKGSNEVCHQCVKNVFKSFDWLVNFIKIDQDYNVNIRRCKLIYDIWKIRLWKLDLND